jgi:hypothetical protein
MMARDDRDQRHKDRRDLPGSSIDEVNRYRKHSHSRPHIIIGIRAEGLEARNLLH